MVVLSGGHSTLGILFIVSLELLSLNNVCNGLLEVYEKECQGTATLRTIQQRSGQEERYEEYRKRYENCTLISDNLEIVHIELSDAKYDFSFLDTIREVNGYVLIYGNHVDRIRLNGLRVIRGWNTVPKVVHNVTRNVSLYVAWNHDENETTIGLKELQLTSLVEIMSGDVLFEGNANLCFGERTINWTYIKRNNPKVEIIINSSETKRTCSGTCHQNCMLGNGSFCWAEGPAMCQAERPCQGCRGKCPNCFCNIECIGGCAGSDASSCVACKNFLRDGACVVNCNEVKYNQHTMEPDTQSITYRLGTKCVAECPENMLIHDNWCVTKCPAGHMENKTSNEKTCIKCKDGVCPKTCRGTEETWLHMGNLAQFNQCTKVEGSLMIKNNSFIGHREGAKIELDDLEILKDIEEITGFLVVQAWHSNLTSLSFLRNLRIIGGIGKGSYSLDVQMTPLTTMDLKSLRQIMKGGVYIAKNYALCYVQTINWTGILTSKESNQKLIVRYNANSSTCEEQGLTCSELCSDLGCWGPGDDNCVSCRNYSMKGRCVNNCTLQLGFYSFTTEDGILECGKCHEECLLECTGGGPDKCKSCRHVLDNGVCLFKCPLNRYRIYGRLPYDRTNEGLENNTSYESYCDAHCPTDLPNPTWNDNNTEFHCSTALPAISLFDLKPAVSSILVVLILVIAAIVVILVVVWRKQKLRKLKESVLANDELPMIKASKAKPDMSLLRLVKESELRRGNMIGSGAFGTVYKGIWIPEKENVKIPVAIKVLQESSNTSQNVELLDEARIMASVCHSYCVRILAVCLTAQMMLITQLMPLGCLLDYVRKEKSNIGSRTFLLWSIQIAKGMKYLEDQGIVHRDLAARNVLVHNPNQVKITDFGLAKLLDYEEDEIHSEGGKMPIKWLALESIQHRIYTHKSDVWSYGVTLWEMFTYGERPYENLAARQIPQALEKGERLPQPYICTIDVYMILIKCWMLDVDSRPTFSDLVVEFTRMGQDPGRFLVIQGDKLMRLPSGVPDTKDLVRLMSLPVDEPDFMVVSGDEYLRPMDLDLSGNPSSYPPTASPFGFLKSIPEDVAYENTRPMNEKQDDFESQSRNGKIKSQFSREPSERYYPDPCRNIPGQTTDLQKKGDAVGKTIRLDEEGYLSPQSPQKKGDAVGKTFRMDEEGYLSPQSPQKKGDAVCKTFRMDEEGYLSPQSTIAAHSYLDVICSPENESKDSQDKQNHLGNQQQQYLDMRPSTGLAKDNPEYYKGDARNHAALHQ